MSTTVSVGFMICCQVLHRAHHVDVTWVRILLLAAPPFIDLGGLGYVEVDTNELPNRL
jgi:hypothetical protein